jgi:hypothetical protein
LLNSTIEQAYVDYLIKFDIKFIIFEQGTSIPIVFDNLIHKSIKNKYNGNQFVVLKDIWWDFLLELLF